MNLTALVDWGNGRALVFNGDAPVHALNVGDEEELKDATGIHLGMWVQSTGGSLVEADPGDYPYEELRRQLLATVRKHDALRQLILHFDKEVSDRLRLMMLNEIEEELEDPDIRAFLVERFKSRHLPEIAGIELLQANPKYADLVSAIEEGRRCQEPVPVLPDSWATL